MNQNYERYTQEDHEIWSVLYERQTKLLKKYVNREFLEGLEMLQLDPAKVANIDEVSERLFKISGWSLVPAVGLLSHKDFFFLLHEKKFPITVNMRKRHELEFSELPDIFHDIYGHVPMLVNKTFCDFMEKFSTIAMNNFEDETIVTGLGRLYWFTLEMGLIQENDETKVYGGAILTSSNEIDNIFNNETKRSVFDMQAVINSDYDNLKLQKEYFIINSFKQLIVALNEFEAHVEKVNG
ncbi:MAG: Aromatic amino acid hydroxylase protein [Bacteroidetes bacterium]|nr:Aromatic amino acid hydroxylase protein [Bacteroidota bacterium]